MNPLEREKQIGKRFRGAREEANLSQAALGHGIGLTRDQVASIELGRVALRCDVADRYCKLLGRSQRWLATGLDPEGPEIDLPEEIPSPLGFAPDWSFSQRYDALLAPYCDAFHELGLGGVCNQIRAVSFSRPVGQSGAGSPMDEAAIFWKVIRETFSITLREIPPARYIWLIDRIKSACVKFVQECGPEIAQRAKQGVKREAESLEADQDFPLYASQCKNSLPSYSEYETLPSAMAKQIESWPELRERLIKLTSERGAKAALAREFKVTPQAVGEWVQGKRCRTRTQRSACCPGWLLGKRKSQTLRSLARRKPLRSAQRDEHPEAL